MAKFKAYEKYVYSDYFKAELPSEWMEKRLNYISAYDRNSFVDGPFGSDLKSSDYKESGVPLIQLNNIRDGKHVLQNYKFITEKKRVELSRHVALPNDIVIAKMAEPVARSAIVSDKYPEYVIVADCVKLSPDLSLINLSFLNWAINSDLVKMNAELVSSGTTRIRISLGELKKLKIPYPSLIEQQAIANFLDHETAQIDTLIEKQQTLIQLLKEKRQAVISHAVTKGLNPDAPMKDSGVEWLGEVPEHWVVKGIKRLSEIKRGASPRPIADPKYFDDEGEYAWTRIADVSRAGMYLDTTTQRLSDLGASLSVKLEAGELFLSIAGTVGKPCITISKACIHDGFVYFPTLKINNKFLFYIFEAGQAYLGLGKMGTQLNLNTETVGGIEIGLPPKEEIEAIIKYIEVEKIRFNNLINKAEQAIQLMQERRTALISAAVTGKIDVRGWRASE